MTGAWALSRGRTLALDRPRLIAILNVTPDSFSDGGTHAAPDQALAFARRCLDDGADMLDIGGESTRPGAQPVHAAEQARRVVPVIVALRRARIDAPISVDTTSASVARAALDAGADAVNDVSAGHDDPEMLALVSARSCGVVLMHRRALPALERFSDRYDAPPDYAASQGGVVGVVRSFLESRRRAALDAGIDPARIVLDPGLGFGKSVQQNIELIARVRELMGLGAPILSAASRKSFLGSISGASDPASRAPASIAVSVAQALAGVRLFRVHDVAAHAQALGVAHALATLCHDGSQPVAGGAPGGVTGAGRPASK